MAKLQRFDYTGKDFDAIVADTIQYLKKEYPEHWTDFEQDNAGRMMIEAFAYICDMLLFYLDRQANECYLPTARERQKVINLCKLIGYQLAPASPAQAEVVFTLPGSHESAVTIPAGTALTTAGGKRFELDENVIIDAGKLSANGNCTEGQTYSQVIGNSTGEPGQIYELPHKGVIAVLGVIVGTDKWDKVDSLALVKDKKAYATEIDAFGRAKLIFGDAKAGSIPSKDTVITANYRVGGGTDGNVAANTIIRMPIVATDAKGQRLIVSVTNPKAASGGTEAEDIAHAKMWAPINFEAQGRFVSGQDYEAAVNSYSKENVGRFAKAKAIVHERSGEANVIRIYALSMSADGELVAPSQSLIDAFIADIDETKMLTDHIEIVPGAIKKIDIMADVCLISGFLADDVLTGMQESLKNFMQPENRKMGERLRYSDLYRVMDSSLGVDWVEIKQPLATVAASGQELIVLGNVELRVVGDNEQ